MSVEAKWTVIDLARRTGQSVGEVLSVKADGGADPAYAGTGASDRWVPQMNRLYFEKQSEAFRGGEHIAIISDPGTHDGREMLLSAAYSWQLG